MKPILEDFNPTLEDFKRDMREWLDGLQQLPTDVVFWDSVQKPEDSQAIWGFRHFYVLLKGGKVVHARSLLSEEDSGFEPMPGAPGMFQSKRMIEEVLEQTGAWSVSTCETCATNDVREPCPPEHRKGKDVP